MEQPVKLSIREHCSAAHNADQNSTVKNARTLPHARSCTSNQSAELPILWREPRFWIHVWCVYIYQLSVFEMLSYFIITVTLSILISQCTHVSQGTARMNYGSSADIFILTVIVTTCWQIMYGSTICENISHDITTATTAIVSTGSHYHERTCSIFL